jgi:signal transduction histidine kinase
MTLGSRRIACGAFPSGDDLRGVREHATIAVPSLDETSVGLGAARYSAPFVTRPCILLVEDNPATRNLYRATLETEGYQVLEAPDAATALARMRGSPPDLVLLELLLPDMSGVELGGRLRDLPGGANIPFLALSGFHRKLEEEHKLPSRFDVTLFKPVDPARLVDVIREHLPLPGAPRIDGGKVSATRVASPRSGPFPSTVTEDVEEHGPPTPQAPHAVRVIRELELQVASLTAAVGKARAAEQEAREASRAKDEVLAAISQELRAPLMAILGWAAVLRKGEHAPGALARGLESIERNARNQAAIVEEVLDVSRILAGKLTLNARVVRLDAIVGAAIDVIARTAAAKGVRVDVSIDRRTGTLSGDPERLKQILWNLVANAVKFTPKGGRVEVRVERSGVTHEVRVKDTGTGIAAELLPTVFDRFRRADGGARTWQGGLGLGLAIVRHLVELHGGSVRAESEGAGKGATFIVTLPALQALLDHEPAPQSTSRPSASPLPSAKRSDGREVLIVEDELEARGQSRTV